MDAERQNRSYLRSTPNPDGVVTVSPVAVSTREYVLAPSLAPSPTVTPSTMSSPTDSFTYGGTPEPTVIPVEYMVLTVTALNESWATQTAMMVTATPEPARYWYNGCCWAEWDGSGWVIIGTPENEP